MNLSQVTVLLGAIFSALCSAAFGLHCYHCHSSEAGCGKELNIRLQRWGTCRDPGPGGGENFCVKVIQRKGSEEYITRDCLLTLREHTEHRTKMPTVQRHGYCSPGRNDDPNMPYDDNRIYCFCNDWNGCNPADRVRATTAAVTAAVGLVVAAMVRFVL